MRRVILSLTVIAFAACNESPLAPSSAIRTPGAVSPGFEIVGSVRDTSSWPCVGCRVEMLDGPSAGTSTVTDSTGRFWFYVNAAFSPPLTLRAIKDGYRPATRVVESVSSSQSLPRAVVTFELESVLPDRRLSGTHLLSFTAHTSCTQLPDEVRQRTYRVSFTQTSSQPNFYRATPVGGTFLSFALWAAVAGNFVGLDTDSDWGPNGILEELTPTTSLQIWGWGGAVAADRSIAVPFWADISYCPVGIDKLPNGVWQCPVTPVRCRSEEHQLTLTPL